MDLLLYAKYLVVLIFVLGLIGLISYGIRRFGFVPVAEKQKGNKKRLGISQTIGLDAKRRLVLIRRDDKEHLLLLGPDGDLVIENNITAARIKTPDPDDNFDESDTSQLSEEEAGGLNEPRLPSLKPAKLKGAEQ